MSQKEVSPTTLWGRLGNVVKNLLVLLISLIVVLGICELILRVYNPLGFRIKGDKIILPVNKTEIIHHQGSGKLDRVVVHQNNSLGFRGPEPPKNFAGWLTISHRRRQYDRVLRSPRRPDLAAAVGREIAPGVQAGLGQ